MNNVTIIKEQGQAVVVQWLAEDGSLRRGTVPATTVRDDHGAWVADDDLKVSIPYGDPFEIVLPRGPLQASLINELHRRNIWTCQDIMGQPDAVRGAILRVFGLSEIFESARNYTQERRSS